MVLVLSWGNVFMDYLDIDTLRKDFVILQLYWWLFSNTKDCF